MSVVASSTGAIVLDSQPVALRQVGALPLDLMDAPHQPDFSAVRLDDRQRWRYGRRSRIWPATIPPAGVEIGGITLSPAPDDHFTAGPDCPASESGRGRVSCQPRRPRPHLLLRQHQRLLLRRGRLGSVRGYKVHGLQTVDLSWDGATSNSIDLYRNGLLIVTVPNVPGFYTDHIGARVRGTYTYTICEAGTGNYSNQVTVRF